MLGSKFPPSFLYEKDGIKIEEEIGVSLPDFDELSNFVNYFISIREKYCPITNYDISGRSSRGIFIGTPDCGIQAVSILENSGICEVATCTYSSDRRSTTSRNCYYWGCENRMKITSFGLVDALERWYPTQCVMTPVYLDLSRSISLTQVTIIPKEKISIRGVDLKEIIDLCFSKMVPFICLRVGKENIDLIKSYAIELRAFEVNDSLSTTNCYICLVPPIRVLSTGALEYPGDPPLPTILSQNQFKTIWEMGGDLKDRMTQWICKECKQFNKSDRVIKTIEEMISSENPVDQRDDSIYSRLYSLLFKEKETEEKKEEAPLVEDETAPLPIMDIHTTEEENTALVVDAVPKRVETEQEKQQGRANSRVKDFNSMLPDYARCSNIVKDYLDIGCADGSISIAIGKALHLTKEHIFGCDVRDLPPESDMTSQFNFRHYDGLSLPYCDNCFDLITVYMVLHHIPHIQSFMKEIRRVLRPGGLVIIREHDCTPNETRLFLDVQHGFYALVLSPEIETPDFCTTFQTYFRGKEEWVELMKEVGLMPVTGESYQGDRRRSFNFLSGGMNGRRRADGSISNLLNSYYAVFRKTTVGGDSRDRWRHDRYEVRREYEQVISRDRGYDRERERERSRYHERSHDSYRDREQPRNSARDRDHEISRERNRARERERERSRRR